MELRQRFAKLSKKQKGFTLVELIVVIAIIGILAGVMLPRYFGFTDNAREAAALSDAKSIRSVMETYYASHGAWPTTTATTVAGSDQTYTFDGTITSPITEGVTTPDGSFTYQKKNGTATTNLWTVTCTVDGKMTTAHN